MEQAGRANLKYTYLFLVQCKSENWLKMYNKWQWKQNLYRTENVFGERAKAAYITRKTVFKKGYEAASKNLWKRVAF